MGTGRGFGRYKGGGWESQGWHAEWIPDACVKITKGLGLQMLYSQYLKLLQHKRMGQWRLLQSNFQGLPPSLYVFSVAGRLHGDYMYSFKLVFAGVH